MSVEFEKVVLKKLDELSKDMRETKEIVSNHTVLINNLSVEVEQLEEKVENNTASILGLTKKVDKLEEKVDIQGQNLATFENEFSTKVQALFDSFVANNESHTTFYKSIAELNAESFNHKTRISKLEDFFKGTKILTNN